jgi:hypothetical protein
MCKRMSHQPGPLLSPLSIGSRPSGPRPQNRASRFPPQPITGHLPLTTKLHNRLISRFFTNFTEFTHPKNFSKQPIARTFPLQSTHPEIDRSSINPIDRDQPQPLHPQDKSTNDRFLKSLRDHPRTFRTLSQPPNLRALRVKRQSVFSHRDTLEFPRLTKISRALAKNFSDLRVHQLSPGRPLFLRLAQPTTLNESFPAVISKRPFT